MSDSPSADSGLLWSSQYKRYYRMVYNYQTNNWEPDWNVAPPSKRRDSALTNQGSPTSSGVASTTWQSGQPGHQGYTTSPAQGFNNQSYAESSNPTRLAYGANLYGASNGASYGAHLQPNTYNSSTPTQSGAQFRLPRGKGTSINGDYIPGRTLHYEELDSSYSVRDSSFFTEGKVLAVMWNETAGSTTKPVDYNTSKSYSEVKHAGNIVFTNVRRFVVVRKKREFCFACPIFTYGQQGCTKRGVHASEHAIAYSWGSEPQYVPGESGITKPSIAVVMTPGVSNLHLASRIYFGIHHPIQYNVKVKEIGYVPADQIHTLISNWTEENQGTNQAADVTENAD